MSDRTPHPLQLLFISTHKPNTRMFLALTYFFKCLRLLPEDSVAELEQITQSLATAGLITPPSRCSDVEPVSEAAWRELIEKLKAIPGKPLSEILIEERGVGSDRSPHPLRLLLILI